MLKILNKRPLCYLLVIVCSIMHGQTNLVPNPSFEIKDTCPNTTSQINYAIPWNSPTTGSPDYYNSCYDTISIGNNYCSVPRNYLGYQKAVGNGAAYGGEFAYYVNSTPYREYMQAKLISTLAANQKYYVTIYVSLGDSSRYAVDNFGIYLSQTAITHNDYHAFGFIPQIQNPSGNFLNDKVNWMKISGSFTAIGNEQYITIGNFKNDSITDTVRIMPHLSTNPDFNSAYYYIDEVCVSTDSLTCNSTIGIKTTSNQISFYYDSYNKKILIKENGAYNIQIVDTYGNKKCNTMLQGYQSIDVSKYENGYYIVTIYNQQGASSKKIIINP